MESMRKPFQGVGNIVKFNWHFYAISAAFLSALLILRQSLPTVYHFPISFLFILLLATTLISLLVSFYVYDFSNLYTFDWLLDENEPLSIVNISTGFDETSHLLRAKFLNAELTVFDFYDPEKHTEISIKRARKAYPPFPDTKQINTSKITLADKSADKIFVILSAHEIRNASERVVFFKELCRVLKPNGQIFIVEHLRDTANFMAYSIGFFHFLSKKSWINTFRDSNLLVKTKQKITPFITIFTLNKNGVTT